MEENKYCKTQYALKILDITIECYIYKHAVNQSFKEKQMQKIHHMGLAAFIWEKHLSVLESQTIVDFVSHAFDVAVGNLISSEENLIRVKDNIKKRILSGELGDWSCGAENILLGETIIDK